MKIKEEGYGENWSLTIKCETTKDEYGLDWDGDKEHCHSVLEIDKNDIIYKPWQKYPDLEGADYIVICPKCKCKIAIDPKLLPDWVKRLARDKREITENAKQYTDDERGLVHAIMDRLHAKYKFLENDKDTLYVKDTATDKHYAIHISECYD